MTLRRLTENNTAELTQVVAWQRATPRWYLEAEDAINGADTLAGYLDRAEDRHNILIWVEEGEAMVMFVPTAPGEMWIYLCAPRHSKSDVIAVAGNYLIQDLRGKGLGTRIIAWVNARHRGIKRVIGSIGFVPTGVTLAQGQKTSGKIFNWEEWVNNGQGYKNNHTATSTANE